MSIRYSNLGAFDSGSFGSNKIDYSDDFYHTPSSFSFCGRLFDLIKEKICAHKIASAVIVFVILFIRILFFGKSGPNNSIIVFTNNVPVSAVSELCNKIPEMPDTQLIFLSSFNNVDFQKNNQLSEVLSENRKKYKNITVIYNKKLTGMLNDRLITVKNAKGKYIKFLGDEFLSNLILKIFKSSDKVKDKKHIIELNDGIYIKKDKIKHVLESVDKEYRKINLDANDMIEYVFVKHLKDKAFTSNYYSDIRFNKNNTAQEISDPFSLNRFFDEKFYFLKYLYVNDKKNLNKNYMYNIIKSTLLQLINDKSEIYDNYQFYNKTLYRYSKIKDFSQSQKNIFENFDQITFSYQRYVNSTINKLKQNQKEINNIVEKNKEYDRKNINIENTKLTVIYLHYSGEINKNLFTSIQNQTLQNIMIKYVYQNTIDDYIKKKSNDDKRIELFNDNSRENNLLTLKNLIESSKGDYITIICNKCQDIIINDTFEKILDLTINEKAYNFKYHYFGLNTYLQDFNYTKTLIKENVQEGRALYILNKNELLSELNLLIANNTKRYETFFEILNDIKAKNQKKVYIATTIDNHKLVPSFTTFFTSLLENKNSTTAYIIHLINNLTEINLKKLYSLKHKYANVEILSHGMGTLFSDLSVDNNKLYSYYKLQLENIITDTVKVIYIDSNTLILKDLQEFYEIDMENKLYKGVSDYKYFNFNQSMYDLINLDISLVNIKSLKSGNYFSKYLEFFRNNNKNLINDQIIINSVCYDNIGLLDPKFSFSGHKSLSEALSANEKRKLKYNTEQINEAFANPRIVNYFDKIEPWNYKYDDGFKIEWWNYAKKSMYYISCVAARNYTEFIDVVKINQN